MGAGAVPAGVAALFGAATQPQAEPAVTWETGPFDPVVVTLLVMLALAVGVFLLGWAGAERLAYARVADGHPAPFGEVFGAA